MSLIRCGGESFDPNDWKVLYTNQRNFTLTDGLYFLLIVNTGGTANEAWNSGSQYVTKLWDSGLRIDGGSNGAARMLLVKISGGSANFGTTDSTSGRRHSAWRIK